MSHVGDGVNFSSVYKSGNERNGVSIDFEFFLLLVLPTTVLQLCMLDVFSIDDPV